MRYDTQGAILIIVYLDLLVLLNLALNMAVLGVAGRAGGYRLVGTRIFFAAAVGSGIFVISFLARQYIYIEWACRILGGLAMAWLAFRPPTGKSLLRTAVILLVSAQLLGGVVYSLVLMAAPSVEGGGVKLPAAAVLGSAGVAVVLALFYLDRRDRGNRLEHSSGTALIMYGENTVRVRALIDSGNVLRHPLSGWPVLILRRDHFATLFGPDITYWAKHYYQMPKEEWARRIALIPYRGVGNRGGMLPAFCPDLVRLYWGAQQADLSAVYVAMGEASQEFEAIAFSAEMEKDGDECGDMVG